MAPADGGGKNAAMKKTNLTDWFDDDAAGANGLPVVQYDVTTSPSDFNVLTLCNFLDSGSIRIPGFQRNFVWDIVRASRFVESLILGLPVPQLFLFHQKKNRFLVLDGQQRLMSMYYFVKGRFPRKSRRAELRRTLVGTGIVPNQLLHDDALFEDFNLRLPGHLPRESNALAGACYATLGVYKENLDFRPIRNIIIRQISPSDDDSSMFEIFQRLNTGGVNLRPQEIRMSMYHSKFYDMLYRINSDNSAWRDLLRRSEPDPHMKDIEILLRGFAMLIDGADYAPSMVKFLNQFSRKCVAYTDEENTYLEQLFLSFLAACQHLPDDAFINKGNNRFNIALYEATFAATLRDAFAERRLARGKVASETLHALATDADFMDASRVGTTQTGNVKRRLLSAERIVHFL